MFANFRLQETVLILHMHDNYKDMNTWTRGKIFGISFRVVKTLRDRIYDLF